MKICGVGFAKPLYISYLFYFMSLLVLLGFCTRVHVYCVFLLYDTAEGVGGVCVLFCNVIKVDPGISEISINWEKKMSISNCWQG